MAAYRSTLVAGLRLTRSVRFAQCYSNAREYGGIEANATPRGEARWHLSDDAAWRLDAVPRAGRSCPGHAVGLGNPRQIPAGIASWPHASGVELPGPDVLKVVADETFAVFEEINHQRLDGLIDVALRQRKAGLPPLLPLSANASLTRAIQAKNSFKNKILQVKIVALSRKDLKYEPCSLQLGVAGPIFLTTLYPTSHTRQLEPKCRVG